MNYKINIISILLLANLEASSLISLSDVNKSSIELKKLKLESKILEAQLKLKELNQKNKRYNEITLYKNNIEKLKNDAEMAEAKANKVTNEVNLKKAKLELEKEKLESKLSIIKMEEELSHYVDKKPIYLDNPLKKDNTLVISDRRIALNGVITEKTATEITNKINYYNNKDKKKPIFLVIDSCPGGSVMAGYLIIKAMESSNAPVYVVLKSFAASMAAIIVTLADKSYAYSHATMLHHQPSMFQQGNSNLTEQKENYKNLEKWWKYFATPIAKKMGITIDELQKKMYEKSSKGDWSEFAVDAQKLHWVQYIVSKIEDTSVITNIIDDKNKDEDSKEETSSLETISKSEKPVQYLPHLTPTDVYFIYNPNGYYQHR
ncbi:ATP-dependent Clp protease proteolytic subunit [hydrothermal vent metagenome]|uniref:ATP-dependent Clp protease proteolytic subunit n=1 Tax=hydrothermal vent metagenome TaxID=652676 RepID=A0A1W1BKK5_9ZZZZ